MKQGSRCWVTLLGLLAAPALAANKCVDASGRISYQAAPCPASARGGDMGLNVNRPFAGQAKNPSTAGSAATTVGNEDALLQNEQDGNGPQRKDAE
jgi:hypothetical protein